MSFHGCGALIFFGFKRTQMIHYSKINTLTEKKDSAGKPVPFSFKAITMDGEIITGDDCTVTSSNFKNRTRNVKYPSGQIRKLKNISFTEINGVKIVM